MKSLGSATNVLKRLYTLSSSDTLQTEAIFQLLGKDRSVENNVAYVNSRMRLLKHYGLVTTSYAIIDGYRRRVDITITPKGRAIIHEPDRDVSSGDPGTPAQVNRRKLTITSVMKDIEILRELEPGLEILFSVKLKEQPL